jgi:hypothetical protein
MLIYLFIVYSLSNLFITMFINSCIHSPTFEHVFISSIYIYLLLLYSLIYYPVVNYLLSVYLLILYVPYIRGIYEHIQLRKANCALASVL